MDVFSGVALSFRQGILSFIAVLISFSYSIGIGPTALGLDYFHYVFSREEFDISEVEIEDNELKLMSFNIRCKTLSDINERSWYMRADLVMQNIIDFAPDIISFQELKPEQEKYLAKTLVGYDYEIEYREDGSSKEACPIFYRSDKYALVDSGSFWLSETPDVMSIGWDADCYRICTYTILKEKATDKDFLVFSVHLDHVGSESRKNSINLIVQKIDEFGDIPTILMGDFNAGETSSVYATAAANFDDVKYQTEDTMESATYHNWGQKLDIGCIDYIFVSKGDFITNKYFVQTTTYDGVYPSDHFPVCAVLEFK